MSYTHLSINVAWSSYAQEIGCLPEATISQQKDYFQMYRRPFLPFSALK